MSHWLDRNYRARVTIQAMINRRKEMVSACENEIVQLCGLLRPLAELQIEHLKAEPDDQQLFIVNGTAITLGDVRRANAALLARAESEERK